MTLPSDSAGLTYNTAQSAGAIALTPSISAFDDPERYGRDLTRLSQEILQQLAALDGVELDVTVEVHARRADGFPDNKVRVVLENAHTLRFTQASFEND